MPGIGTFLKTAAKAAAGYIKAHPDEIARAAVNAAGLRFGIPIAALRFAASQLPEGKKVPKDIELGTTPPALRLGASVDAMGTQLRASGSVKIDGVEIAHDSLRITVRVNDLKLKLLDEETMSPVALLVKSGVLDLSKPGNVIKHLPKRSPAIVEAEGDRITIDLMKLPKLAENRSLKKALAVIAPLIGIRAIETDGDHVYVALRATPAGLLEALDAIRSS